MSVTLSRRFVALALFCAALLLGQPTSVHAQQTYLESGVGVAARQRERQLHAVQHTSLPRTQSSTGRSMGAVPLLRRSSLGDTRLLPSGITRRSVAGLKGFSSKAATRAQIGGSGGSSVADQVVDETVSFLNTDERTPYWTSDEQYLYYTSNQDPATPTAIAANGRYHLYRIDSQTTTSTTPVALNAPDDASDYRFPQLSPAANQILFVRSTDNATFDSPAKTWGLYVSNLPPSGSTIDTTIGGATNLIPLVLPGTLIGGRSSTAFSNVQSATWASQFDIVFSGLKTGDTVYHLYDINITTGIVTSLTTGLADERNPRISPDSRAVAFDSNASVSAGGATQFYSNTVSGSAPATATVVSGGARNIFILHIAANGNGAIPAYAVTQFTDTAANANLAADSVDPSWSFATRNSYSNPTTSAGNFYIAYASTRFADATVAPAATHDIYFALATGDGGANYSGTDVNANMIDTGDSAHIYDDLYPVWSPFQSVLSVAFESDRTGQYIVNNFPASATGFQIETQKDLFEATVIDIDAPTLIRYNTNSALGEVVHINLVNDPTHPFRDASDNDYPSVRVRDQGLVPGAMINISVRVDDRQTGLRKITDPTTGLLVDKGVFVQIKNPNSRYQSIAQGGNGVEHKEFGNFAFSPVISIGYNEAFTFAEEVSGVWIDNPYATDRAKRNFVGPQGNFYNPNDFGIEYEAEAVGITNTVTTVNGVEISNGATVNGDYHDHPYSVPSNRGTAQNIDLYEAGEDDVEAFSGYLNPPLDGGTYNGVTTDQVWLALKPLYQRDSSGAPLLVNGLPAPELPSDNSGGVLYGATLTVSSEASDWYMDVILYDNAIDPFDTTQSSNWIVYDNIWGFSTSLPIAGPTNDVLFVSDYSLGQKFFRSRFDSSTVTDRESVINNLLPIDFGAESYYTDVDTAKFLGGLRAPASPSSLTTPRKYDTFGPFISPRVTGSAGTSIAAETGLLDVPNTLGVKTYSDSLLDNFETTQPDVDASGATQQYELPDMAHYSIWRTLARGPVPLTLLQAYLPQTVIRQADSHLIPGTNTPYETANTPIFNAQRLVIWSAPFSGDQFVGSGTITDSSTQSNLTTYVQQGGRLFISGQDIGFALEGAGGTNLFYQSVLMAQYVSDTAGGLARDPGVTVTNGGALSGLINNDAWTRANHQYGTFNGTDFSYSPPSGTMYITNADSTNYPGADLRGDAAFTASADAGITSGDLENAGGSNDVYSLLGSSYAVLNYSKVGTPAMSVATMPVGASTSENGIVVYAGFGFESLSNDWHTYSLGSVTNLQTHGRRAEIMHNIICALRSGTIYGRVQDNTGAAVAGVLIRAVPTIAAEPLLASGTALTDGGGNFQILGLQPDSYVIFGYKPGYYTQHSAVATMHGASKAQISLSLKAASPGSLSGFKVSTAGTLSSNQGGIYESDGITPIAGIQVQAISLQPDGTHIVFTAISSDGVTKDANAGVVLPKGAYDFPALPIYSYTVIANSPTTYASDGLTVITNPAYNPAFSTITVTDPPDVGFTLGTGTTVTNGLVNISENCTALINFFLTISPQPITGTVIDQDTGKGIPGAVVTLTASGATTAIASGTTDATGTYQLALIAPATGQVATQIPGGTYTISIASAPGYSLTNPPSNVISVGPFSTGGNTTTAFVVSPLQLKALAPGAVSGLVTYSIDGTTTNAVTTGVGGTIINLYAITTVNGVQQTASTPSYSNILVSATPTTITLADGTSYTYNWYELGVAPGNYVAVIVPAGGAVATTTQVTFTVVENSDTVATGTKNVNFLLASPKVYAPGLQLISLPSDNPLTDPRSLFAFSGSNQFNIAEWTGTAYNIREYAAGEALDTNPKVPIHVGKGYFVHFFSEAAVAPLTTGTFVTTKTTTVSLAGGWNLIGNPFVNQTDPSKTVASLLLTNSAQVNFTYTLISGATAMNVSLAQAVSDGVVQENAYEYITNGNNYVAVQSLAPYTGYWFFVNGSSVTNGVVVTFGYPGTGRAEGLPVKVNGKYTTITRSVSTAPVMRSIISTGLTNWRMQLAARQGDAIDEDNTIGVSPDAKSGFDARYDSEKPPLPGEGKTVYLTLKGIGASGRAASLTDMIQLASGSTKSWSFTIGVSDADSGDVTVYWPSIERLPRGIEPILVDSETGRRTAMRNAASSYTYATRGRSVHAFSIEVGPPSSLPLDIVNLRSVSTRAAAGGSSLKFAFAVTRESDVEADVVTLSGRVIRRMTTRAVSGAESSITWDYRDTLGSRVPGGSYVLSLTAKDPATGATVRRQIMVLSLQ